MIRKFSSMLRQLTRDQRGNNLIAYALILGAIGVAGAGYLANVSAALKAGLNNQGAKLAQTAGTTWPTLSSPTATSPSSPTSGTPTSGSPGAGSGSGSGSSGSGSGSGSGGNGNNGNNGNGNNGNGNGNSNGGVGNGNGNGNK